MKKWIGFAALGGMTAAIAAAAGATTLGPHAARCDGGEASVIVNVTGFRVRSGSVRVQLYAANPRTFLERRAWLQRIDVPMTRSGDMPICVPVGAAGRYAISVRHDANGDGHSDHSDGGGFSGNPDVSILDMALRRKPNLARVGFQVNDAPVRVNVILNYVQGTSFEPISPR